MGCLDDFLATIGEGVIIGSAKGGGWRVGGERDSASNRAYNCYALC